MILLFGSIYGNDASDIYHGYGMVDVSIPAYFALIISVTAIMSIPLELSNNREKKILKKYMATPVRKVTILSSQLLVNSIITILGIILLYIVGIIAYRVTFLGNIFLFVLVFLLSLFSMFAFGLLLSNLGKNNKNTSAVCNAVFFPMLFLSGATIPIELFPKTVKYISKVIPLTYVVDALKKSWMGNNLRDYYIDIIVIAGILILCIILNLKFFRWK
jgi:ABC-2 type transport system permease protein